MQDIQTTGGIFTEESRKTVLSNICSVFDCDENEIEELVPVQAGLTNVVLSFRLRGGSMSTAIRVLALKSLSSAAGKPSCRKSWRTPALTRH